MDPKLCLLAVLLLAALVDRQVDADYIWHNDEIPYEPKARCRRGHSYYSNSRNANETDIDVASDVESLLDYDDSYCVYCVCHVDGRHVKCINRMPMFCEYIKGLRSSNAARDMYTQLFQQDRPTYFRQISWRLRRTMDSGMYDFLETVGGEDLETSQACVPFVSEYNDCTEENRCTGCTKCMCVGENQWSCHPATDCQKDDQVRLISDNSLDSALYAIQHEMKSRNQVSAPTAQTRYVPEPSQDKDLLLGSREEDLNDDIPDILRNKRSVDDHVNHTSAAGVSFYHAVDEINEDTLKHVNESGTLKAHKVEALPTPNKASRRTGVLTTDPLSKSSLHIEYNQPKIYDHHLTDNKIDAVHNDDTYDAISHQKINEIIGNHTQKQKDKVLSKLVVNELKSGSEVIGDNNAPVMSNITFTPENDTLTAMAFIAGNLLNKLWNMEKDSGEDSKESDMLKHEKISDLLDLFKEPLNLRQETFLKTALEQLSEAVDKDKTLQNVSLCGTLKGETLDSLRVNSTSGDKNERESYKPCNEGKRTDNKTAPKNVVNTAIISKISNVLTLINKFQSIQNDLFKLKKSSTDNNKNILRNPSNSNKLTENKNLTPGESESLNVFGNILEKITKLLLPHKKGKKITKSIRNQNVFKNNEDLAKILKDMYNIDVDNATFTAKDRLLFDYLNTVKRNPKCLLESLKDRDTKPMSRIEGDILLNLSEFFKVKSLVDLLKVVTPPTKTNVRSVVSTTSVPETTTKTTTTTVRLTTELDDKLKTTKDKLRMHLRNIIDDLIEIQSAKGQATNNISIADALPCIFKILNSDNDTREKQANNKQRPASPVDKVAAIFESLKKDLQAAQNRRSSGTTDIRPKSAVVWERMVKHFAGNDKQNTRRRLEAELPKTFDELKKQMDQIESSSKTYKNMALVKGVPPSGRQVLLKLLQQEVKQYNKVLDDISISLDNLKDISTDNKDYIIDFVDNAAINFNLNRKVLKAINVVKPNDKVAQKSVYNQRNQNKENYAQKYSMKMLDITENYERNNIKLTRDEIINQLIKNRMQLYIRIKESKGQTDLDINYDIAKKILANLENGNQNLARELYKLLITQNKSATTSSTRLQVKKRPSVVVKEPLMQFAEPKSSIQWLGQDAWLKQLANLKNMRA